MADFGTRLAAASALTVLAASLMAPAASAQNFPISPTQRATAEQVAQKGVPIGELAPNAPDVYTVKRGDTLWAISGIYLLRPWRWPELWGMNLQQIRNPHLIFPGQKLYLEKKDGYARLRTSPGDADKETVRLSPRTRYESLAGAALPTLPPHLIEPFLTEPLVVDDDTFQRAPRIVALAEQSRVLVAKGDRAYVRGPVDAPLLKAPGLPTDFRVFRTATPLKDPVTGEILGYEGQYVGQAWLARGESETEEELTKTPSRHAPAAQPASGDAEIEPPKADASLPRLMPVPATIDVVSSKEEMRAGDRLLPEPPREYRSYVPHAPDLPVEARVVLVHGNSVRYAGQNQIVVINKGLRDGIEHGHVLSVLTTGPRLVDKTDKARSVIQLPDEHNGVAMVFRMFERVSYALVMESATPIQVGDKLVNPN